MRLAYLDAFAGVGGDMLLGALIHAGAPIELLHETLRSLHIGATLEIERVDRAGINATHIRILTAGEPAGHSHHHHHEPHRSLSDIRKIIAHASLAAPVEKLALRAFTLLGEAEAKIHGIPLDAVHFHEVGAVDAIADIVLTTAAAHALGIEAWHGSPLNVGSGTVQCAHGRYPVPAPATAELLLGAPTYSSGHDGELVTPTGAALVRALACSFGSLPRMKIDAVGYGAGTRNPAGFANVARVSLGEATTAMKDSESVTVIETAIDDCNPQVIAYFTEQALQRGAFDVMRTPVFMKKNRSGILLTILTDAECAPAIEDLLLRETSTIGMRIREERRICLDRRLVEVTTEWGRVRLKVAMRGADELNVTPEFDDCRLLAEKNAVPVKRVLEAALQAYRREQA
jgi:uncharacterized protein (TIGR00299 family) protein